MNFNLLTLMQNRFITSTSKNAKKFRSDKLRVQFNDVLGCDSAKKEIMEIIDFLEFPEKYKKIGARQPKGVMLSGLPGTGKTMLAKAAASEANIPFYYICGSEFVERYVGVGAANVRSLFAEAKRNAPSIIFIDEIDAIGSKRGKGVSSNEQESTLNQLLVEMDGFESHDQVVVIASTNRIEIIDPALKRPGRFDRLITLDLPEFKGRKEILEMYLRNIRLEGALGSDESSQELKEMKQDFENLLEDSDPSLYQMYLRLENYKKKEEKVTRTETVNQKQKIKSKKKKKADHWIREFQKFIQRKVRSFTILMREDIKKKQDSILERLDMKADKFGILDSKIIQKALKTEKLNQQIHNKLFANTSIELTNQSNRIASVTDGFSGADLKNLCNEAAILAARENYEFVKSEHFEEARERIMKGLQKEDQLDDTSRRSKAVYQSGSVIVSWFSERIDPPLKISITSRSKDQISSREFFKKEAKLETKNEIKELIKCLISGRVAELLFTGYASTYGNSDLENAMKMTTKYVTTYAMTKRYLKEDM
jgi:ATP-dependent Zn protease